MVIQDFMFLNAKRYCEITVRLNNSSDGQNNFVSWCGFCSGTPPPLPPANEWTDYFSSFCTLLFFLFFHAHLQNKSAHEREVNGVKKKKQLLCCCCCCCCCSCCFQCAQMHSKHTLTHTPTLFFTHKKDIICGHWKNE
jgi:hypothetical protein